VLPMIKSRTRDGRPNPPGLEKLQEILGKRIVLDDIFSREAIDYLCEMCGGFPRDLMTLVRYATRYPQKRWPKPLGQEAAERAVGDLINEYSHAIPDEHYPLLAQVHLNKTIRNDAAHRLMLYNSSVLEYYNGPPAWQDVHPVVLKLPKFESASALEKKRRELAMD
jgi:hypothetical protein